MNFGALPERLAHVRAEIARRQAIAGRTHPVTIVAVTKGFGLDAVAAALDAGLTDLGENRVQEALDKIDTPAGRRATWHLIGHLQRNKAKLVSGRFALVHSLDSVALAEELDKRAGGAGGAQGARQGGLLQGDVGRGGGGLAAGDGGGGGAEERVRAGRDARRGAPRGGLAAPGARRVDDHRAVHRCRGRAAAHVPRAARVAGRLAGGGPMAADALDGDVRRLRYGGRGGGNGDPLGYSPVRSEGGDAVSEPAFHLTPLDVRKQEFRRSLRGYEPVGEEEGATVIRLGTVLFGPREA